MYAGIAAVGACIASFPSCDAGESAVRLTFMEMKLPTKKTMLTYTWDAGRWVTSTAFSCCTAT
eukprot:3583153-Rhodomonas_salina.3